MNESHLKSIIPSHSVRSHLKEIGHQFTDRELTTMINCFGINRPIAQIHEMLQYVADHTEDEELKNDINKVIQFEQEELNLIKKSLSTTVFMLELEEDDAENGFFFTYNKALSVGMRLLEPFRIKKYRMLDEVDESEQADDISSLIGQTYHNRDGEIVSWSCSELSERWYDEIQDVIFREAFTRYPHPFKKGDIVRNLLNNTLGIIITDESKEAQDKRYQYCEKRRKHCYFDFGPVCDWFVDGNIFMGDPIEPRYLEFATEEEIDNHPSRWKILCARDIYQKSGSLAYLIHFYKEKKED